MKTSNKDLQKLYLRHSYKVSFQEPLATWANLLPYFSLISNYLTQILIRLYLFDWLFAIKFGHTLSNLCQIFWDQINFIRDLIVLGMLKVSNWRKKNSQMILTDSIYWKEKNVLTDTRLLRNSRVHNIHRKARTKIIKFYLIAEEYNSNSWNAVASLMWQTEWISY